MGTPATIGMQHADGVIKFVSVNYDGYVSRVGRILHEHYQSIDKVEQLIGGGDISTIGHEIGSKHDFDKRPSADNGDALYTTFYGRDRNERGTECRTAINSRDFIRESDADYTYLYASVDNKPYEWYLCSQQSAKLEAMSLAAMFAGTVQL